MKKLFAIVIVFGVFALTSCGGNADTTVSATDSTTVVTDTTVVVDTTVSEVPADTTTK